MNPSRPGGFHCGLSTVPKKRLRRSLAPTNCLAMVGKSNPFVRSLGTLRSIMLLRRCWDKVGSQIGFDASEGRKGPFPSCSGNRDCEIDPRQLVYLTKHAASQTGAAASMFARVQTLVTLEAMSGQLFRRSGRQHAELSFKLPHVHVLVIQVVNFRRDQWSIICRRNSQSDHESRPKAW